MTAAALRKAGGDGSRVAARFAAAIVDFVRWTVSAALELCAKALAGTINTIAVENSTGKLLGRFIADSPDW
ncbi:hypothetical protein [Sphingomonas koreensis]|uniref:hypothetical protein n=1 Tax=Sphingomonas koreensis TaxID=93064 RepID=UPI00234F0CEA|nr:hypothetical protein [Sphingomonas koreensis]MDC7810109.1 hypothetical protein [Sphingomonas koreensis]